LTEANQESPNTWHRTDIHMHTNLGDGTASPERVVAEALRHGLSVIAVTDHDHIDGALRIADLVARHSYPLEVIIGSEVTTRQGHFLALFIERPIKMLRSIEWTIEAIKAQNGLCIVPHPLGRLVPSLSRAKIDELLARGFPLDGLEVYNPSPANARYRAEVRRQNQRWGLAETGGSDAHFWQHIGSAYTLFPGATAQDLRQAILARRTRAGGEEVPPVRLPATSYVAQCALSWFVDPPRKVMRLWRQRDQQ
jgi:predicted metal-dependent phosphoesterase TrpH